MRRLVLSVVLLLITFALAGCGSSLISHEAKSEVNASLDQYIAAYKSKNVDAMADVYIYPTKSIDENGVESTVSSRDEMKGILSLGFLFITEVHDFQIINRVISVSGNTALVTATMYADTTVLGMRSQTTSEVEITMVNSGGWKISVVHTKSSTTLPVN